MTREENIRAILESHFAGFKDGLIDSAVIRIMELEQEPILDKIRAEIAERMRNSGGEPNRDIAFNVCLKIIDKYKAESEDKE